MAVQFPWENAPKSGKGFRLNEARLRAGRFSVSVACLFWYENVGHLGFSDFIDSNVRTLSPITFEDGFRLTSNHFHMNAWSFAELGKKTASQTNSIFLAAVAFLFYLFCLFWYENVGHLGFRDLISEIQMSTAITFEDGFRLTSNHFHMKAWSFADLGKKPHRKQMPSS